MSEIYELKAEMRERAGKGAARAVRRQGKVPAIIYGDKKPPLSISLTYKDVFVKLHGGGFLTTLAMIDVGGPLASPFTHFMAMNAINDDRTGHLQTPMVHLTVKALHGPGDHQGGFLPGRRLTHINQHRRRGGKKPGLKVKG